MHRFRGAAILAFLVCPLLPSPAPAGDPYQEIRVSLPFDRDLARVLSNPGLELMGLGDGEARLLSNPEATRALVRQGYAVEIIIPDLETFYSSRQGKADNYGVWHTYAETVAELSLLHDQYPEITTAPFSIGRSNEERDLWAIKISDHAEDEEGEPEVLFDGVHHAREIMSLETCLYIARYLCENYQDEPLTRRLVDDRQIYIVPIVNPDGFVYNETLFPGGGGMWRKNRSNNASPCRGVDLNRNYPFMWGLTGSSGNPCADDYRGSGAMSEPETQAMVRFVSEHRFVTHESIHSVAGMILFPWSHTTDHTPDDGLLRAIASLRSSRNGYMIGQAPEILYLVSGGMGDWAYGEQTTKSKILSFTTEIGGSGFWPDVSEREPLLEQNLASMLDLIRVAGPALSAQSLAVAGENGEGRISPGSVVDLVGRIVNDGFAVEAREVRMRLRCDDPYVLLLAVSDSLGTVPQGEWAENAARPFRCLVEEGCPRGRRIPFTMVVDAAGSLHVEETFILQAGQLPVIYGDDFEDAGDEWQTDGSQSTVAGAFVRIDPNPTQYQPDDDTTPDPGVFAWVTGQNVSEAQDDVDSGVVATRSPEIDLSSHPRVRLSTNYFFGQRDGGDDPEGDWFRIEASSDGGEGWVGLVEIGDQASIPAWRNLTLDLGYLIALTDRVCFRVRVSDGPGEGDIVEGGIDDFFLFEGGTNSEPPGAPTAESPSGGVPVVSAHVTLTVGNAEDPEGDPLSYGFRIFADRDLTRIIAAADAVPEGTGAVTSWSPGFPLLAGTYFWRAYAADPSQRGMYGPVASFEVSASPHAREAEQVRAEPNPSRGGIRIAYFLPAAAVSRIAVYDAQGRIVRELPRGTSASGWRVASWDGLDREGRKVPSGSYWVRVTTPQETRTARLVRIE